MRQSNKTGRARCCSSSTCNAGGDVVGLGFQLRRERAHDAVQLVHVVDGGRTRDGLHARSMTGLRVRAGMLSSGEPLRPLPTLAADWEQSLCIVHRGLSQTRVPARNMQTASSPRHKELGSRSSTRARREALARGFKSLGRGAPRCGARRRRCRPRTAP